MQDLRVTAGLKTTMLMAIALLLPAGNATLTYATEKGGTAWPLGAESYASASSAPKAGVTQFLEYTVYFNYGQMNDGKGQNSGAAFKGQAFAVAGKLKHNWGVKILGGEWGSYMSIPLVDKWATLGGTDYSKTDISNLNLCPIAIYNHKKNWHWYYEVQVETPGTGYQPGAMLNIGQHNVTLTPAAGITWTPQKGAWNLSSRFDYSINGPDHATDYHSGNEAFWQYGFQRKLSPKHRVSLGAWGFYYRQTTDDKKSGAVVVKTNADGSTDYGYRGREFDIGPQLQVPFGKLGAICIKWGHGTVVENRPAGNSFWFQFGIPFSYLHHTKSEK